VSLVQIASARLAVEDGARRIQRSAQGVAMDAVDESSAISGDIGGRVLVCQGGGELGGADVIGVQRCDRPRLVVLRGEVVIAGEGTTGAGDRVVLRAVGSF